MFIIVLTKLYMVSNYGRRKCLGKQRMHWCSAPFWSVQSWPCSHGRGVEDEPPLFGAQPPPLVKNFMPIWG
jgi:hypothetical protein